MATNDVSLIHILVIDDDAQLREGIKEYCSPYGHTVSTLTGGANIENKLGEISPDIVLLDVMMPGEDGFAVLRHIRAVSRVPVIMLSARGEEIDRVFGLELGADDYLSKPFSPRELLARIKAVLRRTAFASKEEHYLAQGSRKGTLVTGSIRLDCARQTLQRFDKEKNLSTAEFLLIYAFMKHAGEVLNRDEILTLAFGNDYYVNDRSVDVQINRLRKLLRAIGDTSMRIRTVWGRGYSWVQED